jgi:hypothetical protein
VKACVQWFPRYSDQVLGVMEHDLASSSDIKIQELQS